MNTLTKQPRPRYTKPEAVKKLEHDYFNWKYKNSSIPENCRFVTKFRDDSANGLTTCIMTYLKINGHFAARVNVQGNYNAKLGRFVHSGSTKGMADITAVVNGKHISIEVKHGKDKIRPEQIKVKAQIEQAGGQYLIVRTFEDFFNQISTIKTTKL